MAGIDFRLINRRGEVRIRGRSLFPEYLLHYYNFYYHCRENSRRKAKASDYYLTGGSK